MRNRAVGMTMFVTALATAASGHAQTAPPPEAVPTPPVALPEGVGSLMQLSVRRRPMQTDAAFAAQASAFAVAMRSITSCEQANAFAIDTRADMTVTSPDRFARVPVPLARLLRSRPLGRPSPPFGMRNVGVRVLILCPTSFRLKMPPRKGTSRREI